MTGLLIVAGAGGGRSPPALSPPPRAPGRCQNRGRAAPGSPAGAGPFEGGRGPWGGAGEECPGGVGSYGGGGVLWGGSGGLVGGRGGAGGGRGRRSPRQRASHSAAERLTVPPPSCSRWPAISSARPQSASGSTAVGV